MGLITWSDASNAAIGALVDPCWWRIDLKATQLCKPARKKDITMKTTTLHDSKCSRDISKCIYMIGSPQTSHGAMWDYLQLSSVRTLLIVTCNKMKETKITCVMHECLQCNTPPMHDKWDRVVWVDELKYESVRLILTTYRWVMRSLECLNNFLIKSVTSRQWRSDITISLSWSASTVCGVSTSLTGGSS